MENTKVYTQQELYDKKIDTDDYKVNKESGAFLGTLMLKAWATRSKVSGNSRPMRAFFDLEDGRKIIALVQPFRKEQLIAMGKIPIGSTLQLYFEPSTRGYVFLSKFEVVSSQEED